MKRSHILLFGANAFGTGLLAPVLSLVLLSHGATLENLSLCIGILLSWSSCWNCPAELWRI